MTEDKKTKLNYWVCRILVGALLVGVGFLLHALIIQDKNMLQTASATTPYDDGEEVRSNETKKFDLINPLLECGELENVTNKKVEDMKQNISFFIDKSLSTQQVSHISVYFRDLNNGPWFGFGEKETFIPGSLLKVPLLIALYKEASADPSFLEKKILFESADTVATPHFKPKASAIPGNVYSVSELITLMIRDSDNNATLLLNQLLGSEKTQFTYSDLGIKPPTNQNYSVTVRTYASFFRILYNATYLNREYSDKALHLLTESAFTKGLRAGVPTSIPIAHKFGERTILEGQENQLHDCGIVYYPGRPYLLCVMTRGSDYENMADAIKTISSIIYKEIKAE
jgi:beta-lactamase class A